MPTQDRLTAQRRVGGTPDIGGASRGPPSTYPCPVSQRSRSLIVGELRSETQDEAIAYLLDGTAIKGAIVLNDGHEWAPHIEIPIKVTEPKPSPGRIYPIPCYFGGSGDAGDARWEHALNALMQIAKGDPVLTLIAKALDDAWADCVESAVNYGRALGPDAQWNVDDLSDEEYEDRMGKARVKA
jgi:hypothetical protein